MTHDADKNKYWEDLRTRLSQALHESLAQYLNDDNLKRTFENWDNKIILSAMSYVISEPILETHAQSAATLRKSLKKYQSFLEQFSKLGWNAELFLDKEASQYGIANLEDQLDNIEDIFKHAYKSAEEKKTKFKEKDLNIQQSNDAFYAVITSMLAVYIEVSGNNLKIGYNPYENTLTGPLYNFLKPVIDVLEPEMNHETLKSRLSKSISRYEQLHKS